MVKEYQMMCKSLLMIDYYKGFESIRQKLIDCINAKND